MILLYYLLFYMTQILTLQYSEWTKRMYQEKYLKEKESIRAYFSFAKKSREMQIENAWELSYVYEGCGVCYQGEAEAPVEEGMFSLASPGVEHCFVSQTREAGALLRTCNCVFSKDFFDEIWKKVARITGIENYEVAERIYKEESIALLLQDDNARNIRHLMWLIAHEYNHLTTGSDEIIKNSMVSLLVSIIRLYEYQTNRATQMVSRSGEIDELLKYIRSNYGGNLSLEVLASHMHLSREYLCRYFKKYTGRTISDYVLEVRISKAKEMLRTTSHSVADIGIYCGYTTVSSFQRGFRRVTGMSPREYRASKER